MIKYPRTQHIEGSRLQDGDHDLTQVKVHSLAGQHLVIEEKVDGANAGISFSNDGGLLLQSRGHYLRGGPREKQWSLFKQWASDNESELFDIIEGRYIIYGEWLYAKHTIYYDKLPHFFLEFDIYDKDLEIFLSTKRRREMLTGSNVHSVPVLYEGEVASLDQLKSMLAPSLYKSNNWIDTLERYCSNNHLDTDIVYNETDQNDCAEGLYIKSENEEETIGHYKYVRFDFLSTILNSDSHWHDRKIIPNKLELGRNICTRRPSGKEESTSIKTRNDI